MNASFFTNWGIWFVGDFSPANIQASAAKAKDFLLHPCMPALKKVPTVFFVGPGAGNFGDRGSDTLPEKCNGCHVIVLLASCGQALRDQTQRAAQAAGVPLLVNPSTPEIVECFFVPSAWEMLLRP